MVDLLGDPIQTARPLLDPMHGHQLWWAAWPKGHPRKADKQKCLAFWMKHGLAQQASHIIAFTEHCKTTPDWTKDGGNFVPAPIVWLRREGWTEWEPVIQRAPQPSALDTIKNHVGSAQPADIRAKMDALRRRA